MKKVNLAEKAMKWEPGEIDDAKDRKIFIQYMATYCVGHQNSKNIGQLLKQIPFEEEYSRNSFQHRILIPFKKDGEFFIGSSHSGIFFINNAEDAEISTQFYVDRIRQEQRHLRNLRKIISRNRLYNDIEPKEQETELSIYFDESGTPDINTAEIDPFFIVTGIVVNSKKTGFEISQQIKHIKTLIHKSESFELKSSYLNKKDYAVVLKQLSIIDYEFATICFRKEALNSEGFKFPKTFYKYAFQFLINDLLTYTGKVNLLFDEYGGKNSKFQDEFFQYIRTSVKGFPIGTISQMEMLSSKTEPFIQLADIISGVVKNKAKGKFDFIREVVDRSIKIEYFPPL